MSRRPSRRGFLAAVGAGTFAVAGCTGISGVDVPGGGGAPTESGNEPTTGTPTAGDRTTDGPTTTTGGQSDGSGEVLEDFENLEAWGAVKGSYAADTKEAFAGSQSVRIENPEGGAAGVFKAYPEGLDLSKHTLSIALKLEKPAAGKLSVEYLAPGRENHLVTHRYVVEELDDWFRVDLGYTGQTGEPNLSDVQELRILVQTDGEPIRFWVDDLRTHSKPDRGKVVLSFDDGHVSQYDVAFQELQNRGWPGVAAVVPGAIGTRENLSIGQLREMRDAGWDVSSHPQSEKPLTAFPKPQQRRMMEEAKDYLVKRGFPDGARFFFAPYNNVSGETLSLVEELHEYGFTFGACPSGVPPAGKVTISRILGRDPAGVKRILDLAAAHAQLVVINYHAIGPEHNVSLDQFIDVLDHIGTKDVDVITPSELLETEQG